MAGVWAVVGLVTLGFLTWVVLRAFWVGISNRDERVRSRPDYDHARAYFAALDRFTELHRR